MLRACRREAERQRRIEEAQQYAKEERLAQEAAGLDEHAEASDSELEELPDVLYCVACDKTFKSDGAMRNHERCAAGACVEATRFCWVRRSGLLNNGWAGLLALLASELRASHAEAFRS